MLRRFLNWLTPGARFLLGTWLGGFALSYSPIAPALPLVGPSVRHGQIWRLLTYAWLPNSLIDLLLSAFALAVLAVILESRWTVRTLLAYSLFVIAASGLFVAMIPLFDSRAWLGSGPLFFGLLVAWGRVCGDETVYLGPALPTSAMKAAMLFGGISLLVTTLTVGWRSAAFAAIGAVWGFAYLGLRTKLGESAHAPAAATQRISRLEL